MIIYLISVIALALILFIALKFFFKAYREDIVTAIIFLIIIASSVGAVVFCGPDDYQYKKITVYDDNGKVINEFKGNFYITHKDEDEVDLRDKKGKRYSIQGATVIITYGE